MAPKWKANLAQLQIAIERLVQNFAVLSGIPKKDAALHIERIAKAMREKEAKSG